MYACTYVNVHELLYSFTIIMSGMFGVVNARRIAKLKVINEIKFGKWIDFGHKGTIYKLKFGWLNFGKSRTTCKTFLLPNILAIWYLIKNLMVRTIDKP